MWSIVTKNRGGTEKSFVNTKSGGYSSEMVEITLKKIVLLVHSENYSNLGRHFLSNFSIYETPNVWPHFLLSYVRIRNRSANDFNDLKETFPFGTEP